jgi:hypothetical protein
MSDQWALLRLAPQSQNRYCEFIGEYYPGVELYFPQYERLSRPHGKRLPIVKFHPVYPGYVFADIGGSNDVLCQLTSVPVRAWFVRFGGGIGLVRKAVICELKHKEAENALMKEEMVESPYYPGRLVRVHLPVASIAAIIIRVTNRGRAIVDTTIGEYNVPLHQVEVL